METAEDCSRGNAAVLRNAMPFDLKLGLRRTRIRHSRSEAGMRACSESLQVAGPNCRLRDKAPVVRNQEHAKGLIAILTVANVFFFVIAQLHLTEYIAEHSFLSDVLGL